MSYQERSFFWRMRHSWYILLTLPMGVTSFLAFAYIGVRGRRIRWMVAAVFYFGVMVWLFSREGPVDAQGNATMPDWAGFGVFAMWIVSFIHAVRARRLFLTVMDRLEGGGARRETAYGEPLEPLPPDESHELRGFPAGSYAALPADDQIPFDPRAFAEPQRGTRGRIPTPPPPPVFDGTPPATVADAAPLDLNRASEAELAALPSLGASMARKAVELREARGGFWSLEDFGHELGLREGVLDRIRPLVTIAEAPEPVPAASAPPAPAAPPGPPPPSPAAAPPPPPAAPQQGVGGATPLPAPFSGPRPFGGRDPFDDDEPDRRAPPPPPPPPPPLPPRPGRKWDF